MKRKRIGLAVIAALGMVLGLAGQSSATIYYDQDVTPDVIFGSGNANGSFTVDVAGGVELGLRGKLRYGASGAPENTFNSNGDGTYSFDAGIAPTQSFPTAVWSVEWSINSNVDGSGDVLNAYTYLLGTDSDPSTATNFATSDPINAAYFDHSIGVNTTTDATDLIAADSSEYATLIAQNNVAQNSWKAHWIISPFDPTVDGTY